uniref:Uncharacterized protein n=1 Tax=Lygus hesperus TaxID=30085 RepID=A0A146LE88_LYGHE
MDTETIESSDKENTTDNVVARRLQRHVKPTLTTPRRRNNSKKSIVGKHGSILPNDSTNDVVDTKNTSINTAGVAENKTLKDEQHPQVTIEKPYFVSGLFDPSDGEAEPTAAAMEGGESATLSPPPTPVLSPAQPSAR